MYTKVNGLGLPGFSFFISTASGDPEINASGEKIAQLFLIPKAGTIDRVHFKTSTITGDFNARVSFRDMDLATGLPSSVDDEYRDISIAASDDSMYKTTGLITSDGTDNGTKRTVVVGDFLWVVFSVTDWTTGDVFALQRSGSNDHCNYPALYTTSWAKRTNDYPMIVYLEYSDGTYVFPSNGAAAYSGQVTIRSSSNPVRRGNKFNFPFACKIAGLRVMLGPVAGGDWKAMLYASDGKTLVATAIPSPVDGDVSRSVNQGACTAYFSTPQEIPANTDFYIYVEGLTTNATNAYQAFWASEAVKIANFPLLDRCSLATQHGTGDPTVYASAFLMMGLIMDSIDFGEARQVSLLNGGFN